MKFETFEKIIKSFQEQQRRSDGAMKLGIDLIDYSSSFYEITDLFIREEYGNEGHEWFIWFCYDSEYGNRDWGKTPCYIKDQFGNLKIMERNSENNYGAFDETGNPICYSIKATWEYLEKNYSRQPSSSASLENNNQEMKTALRHINGQ
jgi:hypothetical protein